MKRNVLVLALCQALMMSANSLLIAVAALVGASLAPQSGYATVPLAVMFLGTLASTFPASLLMKQIGRRAGFVVGLLAGVLGATLSTLAVVAGHFVGFCVGAALIGVFNAFGQYYRFAAADVASTAYRSRAIAYVMSGGVIAAFLGPNLARLTRDLFAVEFASSYASLLVLYGLSLALLGLARMPPPGVEERAMPGRPLAVIARRPGFSVAVLVALTGYGVMNLLMTATPLAMHANGHHFGDTAFVIQGHVFAMFAPSFVTGQLIDRFGVGQVMQWGALLAVGAVATNVSGATVSHFWVALVLLGVGWNFMFIGATHLLTQTYDSADKAKAQGFNDLLIFTTVAITAFSSGFLYQHVGWRSLNLVVLPWLLAALGALRWLHGRRRAAA